MLAFKHFVLISAILSIEISQLQGTKRPVSKYERIRKLYPKVSQNDALHWRMTDENDNYKKHPCKRDCIENQAMTCYYYMVVHYDDIMGASCKRYLQSIYRFRVNGKEYVDGLKLAAEVRTDDCKYGDGLEAELMVVNGQWPGQAIEICYGDTIVADVINSMHEITSIHWHGIHQRQTPHMDGVPHVTQYPIEAGQAYRYSFLVDHAGTNWWHSHTGHQRAFGLAGALISRLPRKQNPHAQLYDFDLTEHVIMLQEWVGNFSDGIADNILINGHGRNPRKKTVKRPTLYESFSVMRGGRYRFRAIYNGVSNCPIALSVDSHDLMVIATDGNDIEPVMVQKIVFHGGERFDFVLHANQDVNNYWLRIKGYGFCAINQLHQEAILHYQDADTHALNTNSLSYAYEPDGISLNELGDAGDTQRIALIDTTSLEMSLEASPSVYRTYYISLNVDQNSDGFRFQVDDISFKLPTLSLLQTRNLGIGEMFCNKSQQAALGHDCLQQHCQCSNVIQVPAFKNVEFVVTTKSDAAHPMHLHGYTFRVVGMGVLGKERVSQVEQIDRRTPLARRRTHNAPLKDSVQVPAFGYTILRFYSDSPGYWLFHCHISSHSEKGMAAVVRVGDDVQMKMCPVSNCGLCNSML